MKYLDYIYYRFTKAYMKWDGELGITGIMAVSLIVSFIIIDIYGIIHLTFFFEKYGNSYKEEAKIIGILIMILIMIFFYNRYKGKYNEYCKMWDDESKKDKIINGILVILATLLPVAFPIIYLIIRQN